jgi:hypothetical protein
LRAAQSPYCLADENILRALTVTIASLTRTATNAIAAGIRTTVLLQPERFCGETRITRTGIIPVILVNITRRAGRTTYPFIL